jgi:hypothetical protein
METWNSIGFDALGVTPTVRKPKFEYDINFEGYLYISI